MHRRIHTRNVSLDGSKRPSCVGRLSWSFLHRSCYDHCACSTCKVDGRSTVTIYSNYSRVLLVPAAYGYTLTKGSGNSTTPYYYIDHRNQMAANHFHAPYQRKIKIRRSPSGPSFDRRNELARSTLCVSVLISHWNGHRVIPKLHAPNGEPRHVDTTDNYTSLSDSRGTGTPCHGCRQTPQPDPLRAGIGGRKLGCGCRGSDVSSSGT